MNSDHGAFLDAIRREPADDTARLVYADWLEETTGRLADPSFIRDQVAGVVRCVPLSQLLSLEPFLGCQPHECVIHAEEGWCSVSGKGAGVVFTRGFVSEVRADLGHFRRHARLLFGSQPVTRVTLTDRAPYELGPRTWEWWVDPVVAPPAWFRFILPADWWRFFTEHRPRKDPDANRPNARVVRRFVYPTRESALAALSRCATDWGRTLVGLPRLYPANQAGGVA